MNPAIRTNGVRYWLSLSRNTITYYAGARRWRACVRAVWRTVICGYYGELCHDCGRPYPLWWSSSTLWEQVVPEVRSGGLFCPYCFDARATTAGLTLQWAPHIFPFDRDAAAAMDAEEQTQ